MLTNQVASALAQLGEVIAKLQYIVAELERARKAESDKERNEAEQG